MSKMVTDDERREVARRLRSFVTDDSMNATVDVSHVLYVLGLHYADVDRIYFCGYDAARLADLIEPSCDRDALLALADEFKSGARVARARRWNEPANAAMAIALADEYEANARRIREALGVSE